MTPYMQAIRPRSKPRPGRLKGKALVTLRQQCFERDNYTCQECKVTVVWEFGYWNSGHMAHLHAKRRAGDSLSNVRLLCLFCHSAEHAYGPSGEKPCPKKVSA